MWSRQKSTLFAAAISTVITLGVSLALPLFTVRDDYGLILLASFPFSILIGVARVLLDPLMALSLPVRLLLAIVADALLSYLGVVALLLVIGFGVYLREVFEVRFFYFWLIGGGAGLTSSLILGEGPKIGRSYSLFSALRIIGLLVATTLVFAVTVVTLIIGGLLTIDLFTQRTTMTLHIPQGFTGSVIIVYDQAGQYRPTCDGMECIYHIPSNGLLLTQESKPRTLHPKIWYIEANGQRSEPIEWGGACVPKPTGSKVVACLQGVLSIPDISYSHLIIGPAQDQDRLAVGSISKLRSILNSLRPPTP